MRTAVIFLAASLFPFAAAAATSGACDSDWQPPSIVKIVEDAHKVARPPRTEAASAVLLWTTQTDGLPAVQRVACNRCVTSAMCVGGEHCLGGCCLPVLNHRCLTNLECSPRRCVAGQCL